MILVLVHNLEHLNSSSEMMLNVAATSWVNLRGFPQLDTMDTDQLQTTTKLSLKMDSENTPTNISQCGCISITLA